MGKRFLKAKRKDKLGDLVFIDEESIDRISPGEGNLLAWLRGSSEVYIVSEHYVYTIDDIFDLCKKRI